MWRYLPLPQPAKHQGNNTGEPLGRIKPCVLSLKKKYNGNLTVGEWTLANVSDDAPRLQVHQELSDLRPGSVAAVIEIRSYLVIDAVDVVSLELTGSLFHHVWASCRDLTESLLNGDTHTHISIHNALWWLLHFIRKKEAVMTPPAGVSQWCFWANKFRWKPLTAEIQISISQPKKEAVPSLFSIKLMQQINTKTLFISNKKTNKQHPSQRSEFSCYKASSCSLHFIYYVMSLIRVKVTSSWRWHTCMQSSTRVISLFWNR